MRCFALILSLVPLLAGAQSDQRIFDDSIQNNWANYSWATVSFSNTSPVHSGTKSISVVDPTTSYQAMYLHHGQINTADFASLHFWIYFNSSNAHPVKVQATRLGVSQVEYQLTNSTPNSWVEVSIPLSSLQVGNVTDFDGFWIQNITGAPLTFYVDDLSLIATPPPQQIQINVDASSAIRVIDGRIYGINSAVWDNQLGTATNVNLLNTMGVNVLRYPGGSLSDDYNWNTNRGVTDSSFQWVTGPGAWATMIAAQGTQGCITVNYGSGTPEQAAAWVAYCNGSGSNTAIIGTDSMGRDFKTVSYWASLRGASPLAVDDGYNFLRVAHPASFGISYWEVGNECYGGWEVDHHGVSGSGLPGVAHDPYTYAQAFASYYSKMRLADSTIHIGMVGITGEDSYGNGTHAVPNPNEANAMHSGWTPVVLANLKALGVTPQFMVHHFYPQGPGTESDEYLLQSSAIAATDAANLRKQITDYFGGGGAGIELQMTEINSVSSNPGKQSVSLVNALFLADMAGQIARTEFNACMWWDLRSASDASQNNSAALYGWRQFGSYAVLADGGRSDTPANTPYPTFYTSKLLTHWGRHGDTVIGTSTNYSLLTAHAVRLANGNVALLVINKSPSTDYTTQIALSHFLPGSTSATKYGYTKSNDLANGDLTISTLTNIAATFTTTFPSYSMNVIVLQAPPSFPAWQSQQFTASELSSAGISGTTDDPDHDGVPNLLEYALSMSPKINSRVGLPVIGTHSSSGKTYLTLSFAKPRAITDITYNVQVSTDLQTWNSGPAYALRTDDGSTDQATFRDVTAIGDTPQHFLRLQVTLP